MHSRKYNLHFHIHLFFEGQHWSTTLSPLRPVSPLSPCKKGQMSCRANISVFLLQTSFGINSITILPSFLANPKHTETEEQDIGTCIYNAWHQACQPTIKALQSSLHYDSDVMQAKHELSHATAKIMCRYSYTWHVCKHYTHSSSWRTHWDWKCLPDFVNGGALRKRSNQLKLPGRFR